MSTRITTAVLCVAIGLAAIWSVGEMALGQVPVVSPAGLDPVPPVPAAVPASPTNAPDIVKAARRQAPDAARAAVRKAAAGGMMGGGRSRGSTGRSGSRGIAYGEELMGYGDEGRGGYGEGGRGGYGGGYGELGRGMPIGARRTYVPDPKMIELLKQDRAMEKASRVLAQKCLASQGADRETLRKELEELTTKHFELRQKRRQMEIESLEKQLERVKATLDKRNNGKDLIIQRRIAKLLGEEDELAF